MLKRCCFVFGFVFLLTGLSDAVDFPDYSYVQGVGWLRLHIVPTTWADAQLRCHLEDATLTAPTTSAITAVMKTTMLAHRLAESSVFTDIYASNPKGDFTSVNGLPMSNISLQWAVGEPNNLGNEEDCLVMTGAGELADVSCSSVHPFFCLKRNTTSNCDQRDSKYRANESNNVLEENQCNTAHNENECNCTIEANQCNTTQEAMQCDTVQGYTPEPRTGSCYKFHRTGIPWHRASMKCASEGAHLAVINSEEESRVLKAIFAQNPSSSITGSEDYTHVAHIGFLDWNKSGQWLTVFGETLTEAGFAGWEAGEPNHVANDEHCGSVTRNGALNDSPCVNKNMPFICEITPRNK